MAAAYIGDLTVEVDRVRAIVASLVEEDAYREVLGSPPTGRPR